MILLITENGRNLALLAAATQVHWHRVLKKEVEAPKPIEKILRLDVNGIATAENPYRIDKALESWSRITFDGVDVTSDTIPLETAGIIEIYDAVAHKQYEMDVKGFGKNFIPGMTSFSGDIDTKNTTHMDHMFANATDVKTFDVSKIRTTNCVSMAQMFSYTYMKDLDLSRFDVSNVKDFNAMMASVLYLNNLNIKNFIIPPSGVNYSSFIHQPATDLFVDLSGENVTKDTVRIVSEIITFNPFNYQLTMRMKVHDASKCDGLSFDGLTYIY
ncbi:MAG: BspA family leucine-rich repeat surface protein [Bacteroidales bacterium]